MTVTIHHGDCLQVLRSMPDGSVDCVVTSPPYYGLRDYDCAGQIGLEETPTDFLVAMLGVFREVHRVLKNSGTCWVNMGDSYANDSKWGGSTSGKHVKALHGAGSVGRGKRYTGLPAKNIMGMPWRLAFALQDDGWVLRQDIVWSKPNPMPETVKDRFTKSHEYMFLLTKGKKYFWNFDAVQEPVSGTANARRPMKQPTGWDTSTGQGAHGSIHKSGRGTGVGWGHGTDAEQRGRARVTGRKLATHGADNRIKNNDSYEEAMSGLVETRNMRSVWTVTTEPCSDAHFATFPTKLIEPCILAGCPEKGIVLDPFFGAGTTGLVADRHNRHCIGIELNRDYISIAEKRFRADSGMFGNLIIKERA